MIYDSKSTLGGPTFECVIRLLVDTKLECNPWYRVQPYLSVIFVLGLNHIRLQHLMLNHMKVLQSNMIQP